MQSNIFLQSQNLIVLTLLTAACGSGDFASRQNQPRDLALRAPRPEPWPAYSEHPCSQAIFHLTQSCNISIFDVQYDGICDPYDACEANCIAQTPCSVLTDWQGVDSLFSACRQSCFTYGPGTCREAEGRIFSCGLQLHADWNKDAFCDVTERCISRCALASSCGGLYGFGNEGARYQACKRECIDPEVDPAHPNPPEGFCARYEDHRLCQDAPAVQNYHCLVYPRAPECADAATFCQNHPNDPWCDENAPPYCERFVDDVWCSPPYRELASYCNAFPYAPPCRQIQLGFELCLIYGNHPACFTDWQGYCATSPSDPYCADGDFTERHCEYYPDSPECSSTYLPFCERYPEDPSCDPDFANRYCLNYPKAPECSSVYLPYCDRFPEDPSCKL